jgi:hypothetical protein
MFMRSFCDAFGIDAAVIHIEWTSMLSSARWGCSSTDDGTWQVPLSQLEGQSQKPCRDNGQRRYQEIVLAETPVIQPIIRNGGVPLSMAWTAAALRGVGRGRDDEIEAEVGSHRTRKGGCAVGKRIRVRLF